MLKYNILIPHKNDPKRLQRCLDSIPHREDLRIIIVDDNSDPSIVDFNHFPGKDRDDVEIILDKEGGGAGHARNIGLKHLNAEKLINADADDFFTYCFNDVLDEYANDDSDIVFLNFSAIEEGTYLNGNRGKWRNHLINGYLEQDARKNEQLLRYEEGSPCSKIFKYSLLEKYQIKFEEIPINDDILFCYMAGHHAKKIKVDIRAIYCISSSPTSITHSLTNEKYITIINVFSKRYLFFERNKLNLDGTKRYIEKILLEIHDSGNTKLYKECLQILTGYGFNAKTMHREVKKMIKKRKINNIITRAKAFVKGMLK